MISDSPALRVVVVDGDGAIRAGLRAVLEKHGCEVGVAATGESALARVPSASPDVVIVDGALPDMTGIEATHRLARVAPECAVLMLAPADDAGHVLEAVRAGAVGYLLKDSELDVIARAVRDVAEGYAAIDPRVAGALVAELRTAARVAHPGDAIGVALTAQERELLRLVSDGLNNATIGRILFVSPSTVKAHVSRLLAKLGVENRVQAATLAVRHGLVAGERAVA